MSKRKRQPACPPPAPAPATDLLSPRAALIIAGVLTVAAFANGLTGDFVHDDDLQIVQNHLIQDNRYFWQALASDVWAFQARDTGPTSNYWRPGFVLWLILNHRLFGLDPLGWHLTNLLLHLAIVLLAFDVLRRLGASTPVAAVATWLFAVHPAHVESVTWISGSPDLLMAVFMLAALRFYLAGRNPLHPALLSLAALLFAGAMFSKEVSVVFPPIILALEWLLARGPGAPAARRAARAIAFALPFAAVCGIYFALRVQTGLELLGRAAPQAPDWPQYLQTIPRILAYYLRQALFPFRLAPIHPLRAVRPDSPPLEWLLPLAVLAVAVFIAARWWRRGTIYAAGIILFAFPLLPALGIRVFMPEELVHERYLYLPLLGLALVLGARLDDLLRPRAPSPGAASRLLLGAGGLASLFLLALAVRYNAAWRDDLALWKWNARVEPDSVEAHVRFGQALRHAGRLDEALAEVNRGLAIEPGHVEGLITLGVILYEQGDLPRAEQVLRAVLADDPYRDIAIDHLGLVYEAQGRLAAAAALFDEARQRLPAMRLSYTFNLAVLRYKLGDAPAALAELESIRDAVASTPDRYFLRTWHLLGQLYEAQSRPDDARRAYQRFLSLTSADADPETISLRAEAAQALTRLNAAN